MTQPLPFVRPRTLEDPELAADLRRDLGTDTLFFIHAIEAALGVQIDVARIDEVAVDEVAVHELRSEESAQLSAELLEEAA